jgi:NTE family protein
VFSGLTHANASGEARVGLVLGARGILGGAWLVGALHTIASETGRDPGSADYIVGISAGAMIGALVARGVPPWFTRPHCGPAELEALDRAGQVASMFSS